MSSGRFTESSQICQFHIFDATSSVFEDGTCEIVTIDQINCRSVVRTFLVSLHQRRMDMSVQWFHQDDATPHVAKNKNAFEGHVSGQTHFKKNRTFVRASFAGLKILLIYFCGGT